MVFYSAAGAAWLAYPCCCCCWQLLKLLSVVLPPSVVVVPVPPRLAGGQLLAAAIWRPLDCCHRQNLNGGPAAARQRFPDASVAAGPPVYASFSLKVHRSRRAGAAFPAQVGCRGARTPMTTVTAPRVGWSGVLVPVRRPLRCRSYF